VVDGVGVRKRLRDATDWVMMWPILSSITSLHRSVEAKISKTVSGYNSSHVEAYRTIPAPLFRC
jgi:hypothetical protein